MILSKHTNSKVKVNTKKDGRDAIWAGPPNNDGQRQTSLSAGELEIDLPQLPKNSYSV